MLFRSKLKYLILMKRLNFAQNLLADSFDTNSDSLRNSFATKANLLFVLEKKASCFLTRTVKMLSRPIN